MEPWRSEVPLHLKESSAMEASGNNLYVSSNAQDTHPSAWNFGFERKETFKIYLYIYIYVCIYKFQKPMVPLCCLLKAERSTTAG